VTLQVLLAAADEPWETSVVRALQRPGSGMTLVRRCMDVADAVATAASGQAEAALLSAHLSGLDTDVLGRLLEAGTEPVVITDPDDVSTAARVTRMGSACVLSWRDVSDLPHLVQARVEARRSLPPHGESTTEEPGSVAAETFEDAPLGQLIAVWGPAGAPGRSTVAVGLAAACAERRLPTLLIDADVYGGAVSSMLAMLDEVSGILAAARLANTGSLDRDALTQQVRQLGPWLHVLTGLPRADRWPQLRPGALAQILHAARQLASIVVVDCGFCLELDEELSFDTAVPRRNGATTLTLERADVVLAVGSADPLGLTRLARGVLDLRDVAPDAEVAVVVNRFRSSLGWSRQDIAGILQRFIRTDPVAYLPEDQQAVDRSAVSGKTLPECAPGSPLAVALAALAAEVTGIEVAPRRRWLPRRESASSSG